MINPADTCTQDIKDKIDTIIDQFGTGNEKLFHVYDQDILLDVMNDINTPACGVIYEGMATKEGAHRTGLAVELYVGILVLAGDKQSEITGKENKAAITNLLDGLRNVIKKTKSPSGHPWEYMLEMPLDIERSALGYYQKWKTVVILT